jgi:hypothetical protein
MPHQRKCTKTRAEVTNPSKRITLPISLEHYRQIVADRLSYRVWVDAMIAQHPELFPQAITSGYTLHDERSSSKLADIRLRRICLRERSADGKKQVFTIAPSGVLPYQVGYTDAIEKALFLRRFGVPFWALSYLFGHDDDYWYRLENQFGRYPLVQTTVFEQAKLPQHLLADQKITWLNGDEVVVATTVGDDCVLGASLALHADTENLTEAYQHFKAEAQQLKPDYVPETVNTDGWAATQRAWLSLFPTIVIIECFLHAFLKIRERCRSLKETLNAIAERVWEVYHAPDAATFRVRAEALGQWAQHNTSGYVREAIGKLCAKADRFALASAYPLAHRTSTMLDRHMDSLARCLDSARFFHGHWTSAERSVRAWALLHNFGPYCPRAKISEQYRSPAHKLNGFVYHENWLHNLLIATSMSGVSG